MRLNFARVLSSESNLLLLDEPTNYLDIVSVRWLTKFLLDWKNELILITHDREFMGQHHDPHNGYTQDKDQEDTGTYP